ncbi:hypothetical protein [Vibrio coralliilyticus]|nr:hypothetical protein [Vibrio coralliilyticus]
MMEININNLKHWQKVEDGEIAGYFVQSMVGIQLNGTAMALVAKEAEAERIQLKKLGHKVAIIQPKGYYSSFVEAKDKIKEFGREDDLGLLEYLVDSDPQTQSSHVKA